MKRIWMIIIAAAALLQAGAAEKAKDSPYKFEEKDEIRQTLKIADPSQPVLLTVDNVFGAIEVQGADIAAVEFVARKVIKAKAQDKIAQAKKEVELKVTGQGNTIDLYVDGPFRCRAEDGRGIRWRDPGYQVHFDFVLKVPRRTDLTLKTVTDGDIAVRNVEGAFDVSNVNGEVALESVAGSGDAHTVNGKVRVGFVRNPGQGCSFKTVNGDVDLVFADGLAADFKLKTMHGEALSDFEARSLPAEPAKRESRDGKYVYKQGGFTGVRIGKGGPEIRCDTLNGDILIRKKG